MRFGGGGMQEKSFREYMARPENEDKLIECQREEMLQLQKARRRVTNYELLSIFPVRHCLLHHTESLRHTVEIVQMEALDFREKVLSSDYESQQNVAVSIDLCCNIFWSIDLSFPFFGRVCHLPYHSTYVR